MEECVCVVERLKEVSGDRVGASGVFELVCVSGAFFAAWTPADDWMFDSRRLTDSWQYNTAFRIPVDVLGMVVFNDKPLSFTLVRKDKQETRCFLLGDGELFVLAQLVEQLLVNGLVIVSDKKKYALEFGRLVTVPFLRPMFELQSLECASFPEFWGHVVSLADKMFVYFDKRGLISKNVIDVVSVAAGVTYRSVMHRVSEFFESSSEYKKVDAAKWKKAFDSDGRIVDEQLTANIFQCGIDAAVLPEAIPFLVGMFPVTSTEAERERLLEDLTAEFKVYERQLESLAEEQIKRNRLLMFPFRVISHDISRSDKSILAFKDPSSLGNVWSTKLLKMYCLYNPTVTYHQGMNDLLQPIFLAFFSSYDFENPEKNPDPEPLLVKTFWCFDSMLRNTNRFGFLANTVDCCKEASQSIIQILTKAAPPIATWLKIAGLGKLMWLHSDLVLLYKRTFKDIWSVWTQFNCSPAPAQWSSYFTAALLLIGAGYYIANHDDAQPDAATP